MVFSPSNGLLIESENKMVMIKTMINRYLLGEREKEREERERKG